MAFKILSPEEAKKRAIAKVKEWQRQKDLEEKKARLESGGKKKENEQNPGPKIQNPHPVNLVRGPNFFILVENSKKKKQCVGFEEALKFSELDHRVLLSNKRIRESYKYDLIQGDYYHASYWTGTIVGYAAPGKKFGLFVEYHDEKSGLTWVFPVPSQFRNQVDSVLVAEHPDYTIEKDGNYRIVHSLKTDIVHDFPSEEAWYDLDQKHGIPTGHKFMGNPNSARFFDAGYLFRLEEMVGPITYSYFEYTVAGRSSSEILTHPDPTESHNIYMNFSSGKAGLVVEAP